MNTPKVGAIQWVIGRDGKKYKGQYLGNGTWDLFTGNTNGYTVDPWAWLAWAIQNKKVKAAKSWATSGIPQKWLSDQSYGHSVFNRLAPVVITAVTLYGVGEGFAAAAEAGGGAAAGASDAAPQASFTGELAQPVDAVDTGLTATTTAPITFGAAATGGGTVASEVLGAASTLQKIKSAAVALLGPLLKPVQQPKAPAAAPKAQAAAPVDLKPYIEIAAGAVLAGFILVLAT